MVIVQIFGEARNPRYSIAGDTWSEKNFRPGYFRFASDLTDMEGSVMSGSYSMDAPAVGNRKRVSNFVKHRRSGTLNSAWYGCPRTLILTNCPFQKAFRAPILAQSYQSCCSRQRHSGCSRSQGLAAGFWRNKAGCQSQEPTTSTEKPPDPRE